MADDIPVADDIPDSAVVPTALAYTLGGDPGVRNPELAERYRNEYKTRGEKFALDYEDVMSKRQAEVENAKRILDETAAALRAGHTGEGPGQMNLPLLQMAAGFFKPTRSGNFGEEFGNALSGLAGGIQKQRMGDDEFNRGMADLTLKRSSFEQEPLKDRAALLKAQQLQQEKGQQAIETAQIKTGAAGADPAKKKLYELWVKDPKNTGKTYDDFLVWESKLGADKNAPALEREFRLAKETDPALKDVTYPQWIFMKGQQAAAGRQTGEDQAKSVAALPGAIATAEELMATVERVRNHPGLSASLGWGAYVPNKPGGPGEDFKAIMQQLKGQAFLRMFDSLRGAGAITEMEGAKATDALAALPLAQSEKQFREQLDLIDRIVKRGLETARQKAASAGAGAGASAPTPASGGAGAPAPTAGGLVQGADGVYRFTTGGQ